VRLAAGQPDAVADLCRLVGGVARLARRRRVGLAACVVRNHGHVLRARIGDLLARVDRRLRAALGVPDGDTGRARKRLCGAVKGEPQVVHEFVPVALREHLRRDVLAPRPLRRGYAVDVVRNCVQQRTASSACAVRRSHAPDERPRRMRARVVVACRRQRQTDDVHVREGTVQDVVAVRQQCLVRGGRSARAVRPELRLPEQALVRLVPDDHVPDCGIAAQYATDVAAVLLATSRVLRRRRGARPVDRQQQSHSLRCGDRPVEVRRIARRQHRLSCRPLKRDPESTRAELSRRRDRVGSDPLRPIVRKTHHEPRIARGNGTRNEDKRRGSNGRKEQATNHETPDSA
jgi:hypothetical protein